MADTATFFGACNADLYLTYLSKTWQQVFPTYDVESRVPITALFKESYRKLLQQAIDGAVQAQEETFQLPVRLLGDKDIGKCVLKGELRYTAVTGSRALEQVHFRIDPLADEAAVAPLTDATDVYVRQVLQQTQTSYLLVHAHSQKLRSLNDVFFTLTRHPRSQIQHWYELLAKVHPADVNRLKALWAHLKKHNTAGPRTIRIMDAAGKIVWVRAEMNALQGKQAEDNWVFVSLTNITQLMLEQQSLLERSTSAERMAREREEYFSFLNHEMRNHLNVIQGVSKLLQQKPHLPEQEKMLQTLDFSAYNMVSLINDILDYAKASTGKVELAFTDFELCELLEKTTRLFEEQAKAKGVELVIACEDDVPEMVKGDPLRINQILTNLLSNAIKFTPSGTVTVRLAVHRKTKAEMWLRIEVEDTGMGIPQKRLQDIFKAFSQVPEHGKLGAQGTGLGLSIVETMVHLLKGKIKVESQEGKGSRFTVILPFELASSTTKKAATEDWSSTDNYPLTGMKVLYVEDVESNQLIVEGYCVPWGVEIFMADSALAALKKLQQQEMDIVLLDMRLPDEDGVALAKRIRDGQAGLNQTNLPIVALSGEYTDEMLSAMKQVGIQDYLLKPVVPERLKELFQYYLRKSYSNSN